MSIVKNSVTLIKSRPEAIFIWTWCTLIACLVMGNGFPSLTPTFMVMGSIALLTASTYIYNDYCDSEMDGHSDVHSDRPIATGEVSKGFARGFIAVTAVLGLGLGYIINMNTFLLGAAYWVMFTLYSAPFVRFKRIFIVKELVIAIAWPLLALAGVYAIGNTFSFTGIYAGLMMGMFSFMGMPALSDSFDEKEDKMYGIKTLAGALSWPNRVLLLVSALVLMMGITLLTFNRLGFNAVLPITIVGSSLLLLRMVAPIYKSFDQEKALKVRKITYLYVMLSQVFVVLGSMSLPLPF
jgi:4-hydroxybenzoate polyprenyltransferase